MDLKQVTVLALQTSILATVFGFGLRATLDDLLYLVRRPGLLARSVIAVLVIMPVLAIVLVQVFDFQRTVEVILVALAISPVPPLLPNRETKAGGDAAYGLGLMATLAVVSLGAIPLTVELLEWYFGRAFPVPASRIATVVMMTVLVPLAAGVAVRLLLPGAWRRLEAIAGWIAKILLPLGGIVLLVGAAPTVWAAAQGGTIAALSLFVVSGLVVGHVLAAPNPDREVVLALSSACRHPAIVYTLANAAFPDLQFGGTILIYLFLNALLAVPYVTWQRRRMKPA